MRKFVGSNSCCSCATLFCTNNCECIGIVGPDNSLGSNLLQDKILASGMVLPTGIQIASRTSGEITCLGSDAGQSFDDYTSYSSENLSQFGYKSIPSAVMERIDNNLTETFNDTASTFINNCCYRSDDVNVSVGSTLADGWFMGDQLDNADGLYPTTAAALLAFGGWPVQSSYPDGYHYLTDYARFMGVRGIEFSVNT